jgi:hypothetical protein
MFKVMNKENEPLLKTLFSGRVREEREKEQKVMDNNSKLVLRNESGAALVVALLMIVILSLIGLASSSTSTFEIRLSGNKRGATDAFYSADSGLQSVVADMANFNASYLEGMFKGDWSAVTKSNFNSFAFLSPRQELKTEFNTEMRMTSSSPSFSLPAGVSFADQPQVVRMLLEKRLAPRGLGLSAIAFQYNYYIIDAVGRDQMDLGTVRSNCEIREKIVRLIPTGN